MDKMDSAHEYKIVFTTLISPEHMAELLLEIEKWSAKHGIPIEYIQERRNCRGGVR